MKLSGIITCIRISPDKRTVWNILTRQIGTEHDVLFEQTENGYFTGHTMNYVKVYCDAADLRNEIRRVRVTKLFEDGVLAELI